MVIMVIFGNFEGNFSNFRVDKLPSDGNLKNGKKFASKKKKMKRGVYFRKKIGIKKAPTFCGAFFFVFWLR